MSIKNQVMIESKKYYLVALAGGFIKTHTSDDLEEISGLYVYYTNYGFKVLDYNLPLKQVLTEVTE